MYTRVELQDNKFYVECNPYGSEPYVIEFNSDGEFKTHQNGKIDFFGGQVYIEYLVEGKEEFNPSTQDEINRANALCVLHLNNRMKKGL